VISMAHAKSAKSAKFCGGAATLKRRTSAATRKSCAVEQIRNGATVRENDATLRGINAQVCENDARGREIHVQRHRNDAGQRETKKPTVGELLTPRNECFYFSPEITAFMSSTDSSSIA
jgi:hypothetical protein